MKNKNGFTLVELLAVIVILGVLLVTATPMVFNAIKDSKKKTKCKVVKEVATLYKSYYYLNQKNSDSCAYDDPETPEFETCNFEELINAGYLDSKITSPITGDEIGREKEQLYVSSGNCSSHYILYSDKNGISVCYKGSSNDLKKNDLEVIPDTNKSNLTKSCK